MYKTFLVAWRYAVASSESTRFQNWMEEKHLLAIERSGYFLVGFKKLVDLESGMRDHRFIIRYTLQPKDEASWQAFNEESRREFDKLFSEEWCKEIRHGQILFYQTVGWEHELGNIMVTTPTVEKTPSHQL